VRALPGPTSEADIILRQPFTPKWLVGLVLATLILWASLSTLLATKPSLELLLALLVFNGLVYAGRAIPYVQVGPRGVGMRSLWSSTERYSWDEIAGFFVELPFPGDAPAAYLRLETRPVRLPDVLPAETMVRLLEERHALFRSGRASIRPASA
jgi:hypothetical protein